MKLVVTSQCSFGTRDEQKVVRFVDLIIVFPVFYYNKNAQGFKAVKSLMHTFTHRITSKYHFMSGKTKRLFKIIHPSLPIKSRGIRGTFP